MGVPFYRAYADAFALQQLLKTPAIPDMKLMVGSAECLEPLPLLIYRDVGLHKASAVMVNHDKLSIEEAAEKIASTSLTIDDFPGNTLYLGEPVGF